MLSNVEDLAFDEDGYKNFQDKKDVDIQGFCLYLVNQITVKNQGEKEKHVGNGAVNVEDRPDVVRIRYN